MKLYILSLLLVAGALIGCTQPQEAPTNQLEQTQQPAEDSTVVQQTADSIITDSVVADTDTVELGELI